MVLESTAMNLWLLPRQRTVRYFNKEVSSGEDWHVTLPYF